MQPLFGKSSVFAKELQSYTLKAKTQIAPEAKATEMEHFPDQMHIDRIRTALWRGREHGNAAVMVGAGFSLNAKSKFASGGSFPTWSQLSERLVTELYPPTAFDAKDRARALAQAGATGGALRIAQEYEAAFGRDALESFLQREIQDDSVEPSELHRLLLSLPWSDILTTNYDTLLERATHDVVDHKYDVVRSIRDIPSAVQPRIVKLHGSFPSVRPFIFTEEDFRTYPHKFAPFVNLAQQSIMENIFCLIGYSGDDPNFLYWTGWVRDNLGASAPMIYLCGLLNLTTARRNMLRDRNVIPIDLSALFSSPSNSVRNPHAVALEWLLQNLAAGEPPSPLNWPRSNRVKARTSKHGLPEFPSRGPKIVDDAPTWQHGEKEFLERIPGLLGSLKQARSTYPGWLIAPFQIRDAMWRELADVTLPRVLNLASKIGLPQRLELFSQLNWQLELCLVLLWPQIADIFLDALGKVNPFPDVLELPEAGLQPGGSDGLTLHWPALEMAWVELALAVLRYFRESQDVVLFLEWSERLEKLVPRFPTLLSAIRYQECLLALDRIDHSKVRSILNEWKADDDDPVWLLRKAAVHGELRESAKVKEMSERALVEIRRKISPGSDDIAMFSREGWAMSLVRASWWLGDEPQPDFRGRWERLTAYQCNPEVEIDLLKARLTGPKPTAKPKISTSVQFDPGRRSINQRLGGDNLLSLLLPAMQAVRLSEVAGHFGLCGRVALSKNLLIAAAQWLEGDWPTLATSLVLRLAGKDEIDRFFSRHRLAAMPDGDVDELHKQVSEAISFRFAAIETPRMAENREQINTDSHALSVGMELLSRLMVRFSGPALDSEITRITTFYRALSIRNNLGLASELQSMIERWCQAASRDLMSKHLFSLMSLPMPGVDSFDVALADHWPEPASSLRGCHIDSDRSKSNDDWESCIKWLLTNAKKDCRTVRSRAILRLARLLDINLLTEEERLCFADALWAYRASSGLPRDTGLLDYSFLQLPEPTSGDAHDSFRRYYLGLDLPYMSKQAAEPDGTTKGRVSVSLGRCSWFQEIIGSTRSKWPAQRARNIGIDWTTNESKVLFDKIVTWWRAEGKQLAQNASPIIRNELDGRMFNIVTVVRIVIGPRCTCGDTLEGEVRSFLYEIEKFGFHIEDALASLPTSLPALKTDLVNRIRRGLVSLDRDEAQSAITAVYEWLHRDDLADGNSPPPDLVREIGNVISSRRLPAIEYALDVATRLVINMNDWIDETVVDSLCVGLHYLLEETHYRSLPQDNSVTLPYEEIPDYRRKAARLAAQLMHAGLSNDPVLQQWCDVAERDPLPEVRRAICPQASADCDEE
jgi:hypothetical protein